MLGDLARAARATNARRSCSPSSATFAEEIAEILEVRPDKVKALIFQAREALAGWRRRVRPVR